MDERDDLDAGREKTSLAMHDLIIRNGLVVDGVSESAYRADVAVHGNQISKIGVVSEESLQVIDAEDCIVTPGFIDLHTHLETMPRI